MKFSKTILNDNDINNLINNKAKKESRELLNSIFGEESVKEINNKFEIRMGEREIEASLELVGDDILQFMLLIKESKIIDLEFEINNSLEKSKKIELVCRAIENKYNINLTELDPDEIISKITTGSEDNIIVKFDIYDKVIEAIYNNQKIQITERIKHKIYID